MPHVSAAGIPTGTGTLHRVADPPWLMLVPRPGAAPRSGVRPPSRRCHSEAALVEAARCWAGRTALRIHQTSGYPRPRQPNPETSSNTREGHCIPCQLEEVMKQLVPDSVPSSVSRWATQDMEIPYRGCRGSHVRL